MTNPATPRKRGQRPYVDLDPADSLLIRQTFEKLSALFIKVHNLSVEVSELRSEQKKLRAAILAMLSDPQTIREAQAIARELRIQTYKKP